MLIGVCHFLLLTMAVVLADRLTMDVDLDSWARCDLGDLVSAVLVKSGGDIGFVDDWRSGDVSK